VNNHPQRDSDSFLGRAGFFANWPSFPYILLEAERCAPAVWKSSFCSLRTSVNLIANDQVLPTCASPFSANSRDFSSIPSFNASSSAISFTATIPILGG
jgi:hypothetical protein